MVQLLPNLNLDEIRTWGLALVAFFGLILALIQYRKDRPRLEVRARYAPRHQWAETPQIIAPTCEIIIVSKGKDPLGVEAYGLQFKKKSDGRWTATDKNLPIELKRYQKYVGYAAVEKDEMSRIL